MSVRMRIVFIAVLTIWSTSAAAEEHLDKAIEAAEIAIDSAIGSEDTLPGHNGVMADLVDGVYNGLVVMLVKDVDVALQAMANLPSEHRAHIRQLQVYVPPGLPEAWKSLAQLSELDRVMLVHSAKWSPEFGKNIVKLKNLNSLHVSDTNVDCAGIEQISRCTKLTNLWLHDNDLSKCDLAPLVNLQELRQLMMENANVSSAQVKFAEFLPKLGWMAISENRIDRPTIDRLEQILPKAFISADDQKE